MSFKIKLFSATQNNLSSLEDEVNSWMSVNSDHIVKDLKVTYSDHNVLITVFYDPQTRAMQAMPMSSQTREVAPQKSFQETLSSFAGPPEPRSNVTPPKQPQSVGEAIDSINPSQVKPGRLIQNNYSKYNKSNQKVSEDQAFNWD